MHIYFFYKEAQNKILTCYPSMHAMSPMKGERSQQKREKDMGESAEREYVSVRGWEGVTPRTV